MCQYCNYNYCCFLLMTVVLGIDWVGKKRILIIIQAEEHYGVDDNEYWRLEEQHFLYVLKKGQQDLLMD